MGLDTPTNLLSLPPEVRLRIYHICFPDPDPSANSSYVKIDVHSSRVLVRPHIWPLFQTCKQIYAEIMPEYYSCTGFHFDVLTHLRQTTTSHAAFRANVRHVVLNPNYDFPRVEDISALPRIQTFTVSNVSCYRPLGTPVADALSHATLAAVVGGSGSGFWATTLTQTRLLYEAVSRNDELVRRGVRLVLRFRYTYVDKSGTHLGSWESAKRHKVIDYRYRDDVFVALNPDEEMRKG